MPEYPIVRASGISAPIVIVGGYGPEPLHAAKSLGFYVIFFQSAAHLLAEQRAACDELYLFDSLNDVTAMRRCANELHKLHPLRQVVSLTEFGLEAAALIADDLGLTPATPISVVRLLRDKWAMRSHLAGTGTAVQAADVRSPADAGLAAGEIGFPVVLKPRDAWGSLAVHIARTPREAVDAYDRITEIGCDGALVEEYLDGREFSVESFSFAGTHIIVAVTEKFSLPNFVERAHLIPARIDADEADSLKASTAEFLTAVGLTDGPAHTEISLTERGPRIIESHNRTGGGSIATLVKLVYGVDLITWAMAWAAGMMDVPSVVYQPSIAACISFLTPLPGHVKSVPNTDCLQSIPGVVEVLLRVRHGDIIQPVVHSFDRAGHVIVQASSPDSALALAEEVTAQARIETEPRVYQDGDYAIERQRRLLTGE